MIFRNTFRLTVLVLFFNLNLNAQTVKDTNQNISLDSVSIDNQFEYLIQKSGKYQDYKVVKKTWLYKIKANTQDSINAFKKELKDAKTVVTKQIEQINVLNNSISDTKSKLLETIQVKDNMSLFGIKTSKTDYNIIMWSIISLLLIVLFFFIFKFKSSHAITQEAKLKLKDLEQEYEEHRSVALEREQKVRRQLQDLINKNKK